MKIGMIGAGKVGVSLGAYFSMAQKEKKTELCLTGFYSRTPASAKEAAEFTGTVCYPALEEIVAQNDILFLTVPDGEIPSVWKEIRDISGKGFPDRGPVEGKLICHCSGLLSSEVFAGIEEARAFGYSIHPLYAVSSKWESYKQLKNAYFTVEGHPAHLEFWKRQFEIMGNPMQVLEKEQKPGYHAAAVFASNFMNALMETAKSILLSNGFTEEAARTALFPMFLEHCQNMEKQGLTESLTGPVERGDLGTVQAHLDYLEAEDKLLYCLLGAKILEVAKAKHPERSYEELSENFRQLLEGGTDQ